MHGPALFHMVGAQPLIGVTMMGGPHVVIPTFTPEAVIGAIEAERVNASMFAMLRDHLAEQSADAMTLFPNARFTQAYGQSEVGTSKTLFGNIPSFDGTCGQMAPNVEGQP